MKKQVLFLLAIMLTSSVVFAQNVWINLNANGAYEDWENWNGEYVPDEFDQVLFDGNTNATDCIVTDYQFGGWFEIGVGGTPYGSVIIKNGGHLESLADHWTAVGWTTVATLVVEAGGEFTTFSHLWLGFNAGAKSYVDLYGTINVNGMFGVNFENLANADSFAKLTVHNGGLLNLAQMSGDTGDAGVNSFRGAVADGSLVIMGGGNVTLPGDRTADFQSFFNNGKISTPGGTANISYDGGLDVTTMTSTAAPLGVKDFSALDFEAYPNPTTSFVNIKSKTAISNVKLYNNLGQLVMEDTGKSRVDVSGLSTGYYILKAEDDLGNLGVKKIIKQ